MLSSTLLKYSFSAFLNSFIAITLTNWGLRRLNCINFNNFSDHSLKFNEKMFNEILTKRPTSNKLKILRHGELIIFISLLIFFYSLLKIFFDMAIFFRIKNILNIFSHFSIYFIFLINFIFFDSTFFSNSMIF